MIGWCVAVLAVLTTVFIVGLLGTLLVGAATGAEKDVIGFQTPFRVPLAQKVLEKPDQ